MALTDEQIDREIRELQKNPDVKLARAEMRIKYRKRQYLYQLRNLAKRGAELREAGFDEDNIAYCFIED